MTGSFGLVAWKGLVSGVYLNGPPQVRFENEERFINFCTGKSIDFQIWTFPGIAFLTFDDKSAHQKSLISFHIQVQNEPARDCSSLAIEYQMYGRIVDICEVACSDGSRFWLTFASGLLQEWMFSALHSCEKEDSPHRGWTLVSESRFLEGETSSVQAAGILENSLLWIQKDVSEKKKKGEAEAASLWRLTLPTNRSDGDEYNEVTFGSPVCIFSSLPPCRLKTSENVAVVWTVHCSDAGGDFAFILSQGSSSVRLVEIDSDGAVIDSDGAVIETDFDPFHYDEWMRMRIIDCLSKEKGSSEPAEKSDLPSCRSHSPSEFLFEPRSRAMVVVRKDGSVFQRIHTERGKDADYGSVGQWTFVTRLSLGELGANREDDDVPDSPYTLASVKNEIYLLAAFGRELKVYNLSKEGKELFHAMEGNRGKGASGHVFSLGRMPFPLVLLLGEGLFRVAVETPKRLEDVRRKGFARVLSDVDDLVKSGNGSKRDAVLDEISALTLKPNQNSFLRSVAPDLMALAASLEPLAGSGETRSDRVEVDTGGDAESSVSDRLLEEFRRRSLENSLDDEEMRFLLHQLEYLSHSEPLRVLSSLTRRIPIELGENSKSVDSKDINEKILFATSSSSAVSSPSSASSALAAKSPNSLHSSMFELLISLTLIHRRPEFESTMKRILDHFCDGDIGSNSSKIVQPLECLRRRFEEDGYFEGALALKHCLSQLRVRIDETNSSLDYSERLKSTIRNQEWSACIEELEALKYGESAVDEAKYTDAFNSVVEGLQRTVNAQVDGTYILGELTRLMPDRYDVDQMLRLIYAIDQRPCSSQPICHNPECNHVIVEDLRF